ncbi:NAD(P)-binding protein [Leucogyrophana mollusca]|uniref:NAD(P)-binding protein n=1 Tax=Leucogyrophana mollusca TaxID=85980 RepID=A0ACB8BZ74_9AGAM|nr:NAD(P)-binding protein [Leucogyrophana mollusca]
MSQKIVICGAGFLGSNVARTLLSRATTSTRRLPLVQISSRHPQAVQNSLAALADLDHTRLLFPCSVDITKPETLARAFYGANVVVSLVGIMNGTPEEFERIQWEGAENVAHAARRANARLIHVSAIGADATSTTPYARTKAFGEYAVLDACPDATIIRPSIIFGPGDGFFNRFAQLSKFFPFMPVFGGGLSRFQPVYVGDIGRAIEIISRDDEVIQKEVCGRIIEAGGPDVFTYREIMKLVLKYTNRRRPIVSIPFAVGMLQGAVMERLPETLFTVTRAQVEQLKSDNIVSSSNLDQATFQDLIANHTSTHDPLRSVHDILPTYL